MAKVKFNMVNNLSLDDGETEVIFQNWDEINSVLDLAISCNNGSTEKYIIQTYMDKDEWEAFKRAGDCIFKEMSNDV